MKRSIQLFIVSFLMALPSLAIAHDGHGVFNGSTLIHYLSSPLHAIPVLVGIVLLILFLPKQVRIWKKSKNS